MPANGEIQSFFGIKDTLPFFQIPNLLDFTIRFLTFFIDIVLYWLIILVIVLVIRNLGDFRKSIIPFSGH